MIAQRRPRLRLAWLTAACVLVLLAGVVPGGGPLHAAAQKASKAEKAAEKAAQAQAEEQFPPTDDPAALIPSLPLKEIKDALVRLPLAAVLGTALALRPRRRGQGPRTVLVVQTQIMLAVVGAVIMLVVGNSLSRAFGIVGAAGLVRYRSTIDDPKEAVVMLCALGAGLASGVGLYLLAPFATFFMAGVLWLVEYFEPAARKWLELAITVKEAPLFRPKVESMLYGLGLEYELLSESDDVIGYSISAPLDVRTRDVSDTMRMLSTDADIAIEWTEKKRK